MFLFACRWFQPICLFSWWTLNEDLLFPANLINEKVCSCLQKMEKCRVSNYSFFKRSQETATEIFRKYILKILVIYILWAWEWTWNVINLFQATCLFLCPLKPKVFRGVRKRAVTWNGLKVVSQWVFFWDTLIVITQTTLLWDQIVWTYQKKLPQPITEILLNPYMDTLSHFSTFQWWSWKWIFI